MSEPAATTPVRPPTLAERVAAKWPGSTEELLLAIVVAIRDKNYQYALTKLVGCYPRVLNKSNPFLQLVDEIERLQRQVDGDGERKDWLEDRVEQLEGQLRAASGPHSLLSAPEPINRAEWINSRDAAHAWMNQHRPKAASVATFRRNAVKAGVRNRMGSHQMDGYHWHIGELATKMGVTIPPPP